MGEGGVRAAGNIGTQCQLNFRLCQATILRVRTVVMMSGGTTPVINATLAGLLGRGSEIPDVEWIFPIDGVAGLLREKALRFSKAAPVDLDRLALLPGSSVLGTSRVGELTTESLREIRKRLDSLGVDAVINIGGNGTLRQTQALAQIDSNDRTRCYLALPKTVDNDLGDQQFKQALFSPGFPSAANYWTKVVQRMNLENLGAASHEPVLVAQAFGRETGFLAATASLADRERSLPLLILLPEDDQTPGDIYKRVADEVKQRDRAMVVVTEGYPWPGMEYPLDPAGQPMYGSGKSTVAQQLSAGLIERGITARTIIPTILQRHCQEDVLEVDRRAAELVGRYAIEHLLGDATSGAITIREPNGERSQLEHLVGWIPFDETTSWSRRMPGQWIARNQYGVTTEFLDYFDSVLSLLPEKDTVGSPNLASVFIHW